MYKTLNTHYREKFGCKVYKLSLDGGFTCPNRDGKIGVGGCIFCSPSGGGEFAARGTDILKQLEDAKTRVEKKTRDGRYIAYFQAFTGTYAPIKKLRKIYFEAISPEWIVGLSVGTRPDCLDGDVIELLKEINAVKPVSVELGFQTSNEETARYIRRGYDNAVYFDAVKRLKAAGLEVVTHIIIGLEDDGGVSAVRTTRDVVSAGSDGVKFHLLHILHDTDLEREYRCGKIRILTLDEYAEILKMCIKELPSGCVVHRITGDGDKKTLVAPLWSADKKYVLNFLNNYLTEDKK